MRKALKPGYNLILGERTYEIRRLMGEGADCLVYDALLVEDACDRRVRIKELYPVKARTGRQGTELVWEQPAERDAAFAEFRRIYQMHIRLQNSERFGNRTAHVTDTLAECGGTLYMIVDVDHGVTFRKDPARDLSEVLRTLRALTDLAGDYHQQGMLLLDLKPENFLVLPETRDLVKLIDLGSVVYAKGSGSGEDSDLSGRSLSMTAGYAAPELLRGEMRRIGPHTDLYSICAMLFERIFHRLPEALDRGPLRSFSVADTCGGTLSGEGCECLQGILEKGLCAVASERYLSARELSKALEDAERILTRKERIRSVYPLAAPGASFVGRSAELQHLHELLQQNTAVFVCGFGGEGKTTLALKYLERYRSEYDAIVFFRYQGSLDPFFLSVPIEKEGDAPEKRQETLGYRIRRLREVATERVLFVIDNFDTAGDPRLEDLLTLGAKALFTTRVREQGFDSDKIGYLELGALEEADCLELIQRELGPLPAGHIPDAGKIIRYFGCHAMTLSLVAKYAAGAGKSLPVLAKELKKGGLRALDEERVVFRKDGIRSRQEVLLHLQELFGIMGLSREQMQALENVWVMTKAADWSVGEQAYRELLGSASLRILEDLAETGLVTCTREKIPFLVGASDRSYHLHPLITELMESLDLDPMDSPAYKAAWDWLEREHLVGALCNVPLPLQIFLAVQGEHPTPEGLSLLICKMTDVSETKNPDLLGALLAGPDQTGVRQAAQNEMLAWEMVDFCTPEQEIRYEGGILPWWYAKGLLAAAMGIRRHRTAAERQRVIRALSDANRGLSEELRKKGAKAFLTVHGERVSAFLSRECRALSTRILYRRSTLYQSQKDLLARFGYPVSEGGDTGISLFHKDPGAQELFREVYGLLTQVRQAEETGEFPLARTRRELCWLFSFLNGEFTDPARIPEKPEGQGDLYFADRRQWERKLTASILRYWKQAKDREGMYELFLDDLFLKGLPEAVVRALQKEHFMEMLREDPALSEEEKKRLLYQTATEQVNRFLIHEAQSGKRKKSAGEKGQTAVRNSRQQAIVRWYAEGLEDRWRQTLLAREEGREQASALLKSSILLGMACRPEADTKEHLEELFSRSGNRLIEGDVLLVRHLRACGCKEEADLLGGLLLEHFWMRQIPKKKEDRIRNAAALSRIAPYRGKNALKRQMEAVVREQGTLAGCAKLISPEGKGSERLLWMANILFYEVNADLVRDPEKSRDPADGRRRKQCEKILQALEGSFTPRQLCGMEEVWMLQNALRTDREDDPEDVPFPEEPFDGEALPLTLDELPFGEENLSPFFEDPGPDPFMEWHTALSWYRRHRADFAGSEELLIRYIRRTCGEPEDYIRHSLDPGGKPEAKKMQPQTERSFSAESFDLLPF
ncbi:MAG: hypothetical protein IKS07_05075 [Lachnospiraceae bacterium]|nr:hypothetical protein [Lachnospiraceae bacterium]